MTTSKRAAGDLSGVPRSDSKRNKGWLCSVSGTDGVIVIIFYGDCAFASSPEVLTQGGHPEGVKSQRTPGPQKFFEKIFGWKQCCDLTTCGDPGLLECATLSHRFFIYWIATSASPFNSAPWGRGTTEPSWRVVAGVSKNPPLRRRGIIGALSHSL